MSDRPKSAWHLCWLLLPGSFVALYALAGFVLVDKIRERLPEHAFDVEGAPWAYLTDDVAEGGALAIVLSVCVAASLACWRFSRPYSFMLLWMSALWCLGPIAKAIVIILSCESFFSAEPATSAWPTFEEYHADTALQVAMYAPAILILGAMIVALRWAHCRTHRSSPNSTA